MSKNHERIRAGIWLLGLAFVGLAGLGAVVLATQVPTTRVDFFTPGTQPLKLTNSLASAETCASCHADYDPEAAPLTSWKATMMAQAARDPIFQASHEIAEHDAAFSGDACLRCHAPMGWLEGRADATDGSHLTGSDFEGVSCALCHRMVDPIYTAGQSPSVDSGILAALSPPALTDSHNGAYVVDPKNRRRGPFDLIADWASTPYLGWPDFHSFLESPFHESSRMCATCHDVSLPHYTRQPDGSYALNTLNTPGPSKYQQFPEQRTFSEWAHSLFAQQPVDLGTRFGGTRTGGVASCQDCHMPGVPGTGCGIADAPQRTAVPKHSFAGSNTWVIAAVRSIYPDSETFLTAQSVATSIENNADMLRRASDLELSQLNSQLATRIVNYTGHKLPTGYPEGRRMWINVQFLDAQDNIIAQRGAYDSATAVLNTTDTEVYEAVHGIDANVAALTGHLEGPLFRLAVVNKKYKDNRIPPMGYALNAFDAVGAAPVPTNRYADGQYWDDQFYTIPNGAAKARVRVMYQTTSKEYIEFIRDAFNPTPSTKGTLAYSLWETFGKSEPVVMDDATINFLKPCDIDRNGAIGVADIFAYLNLWFSQFGQTGAGHSADFNGDQAVTVSDIFAFLNCWFANF